ncbi:rhomboid family intramembrane serine protease [Corynebacterium tapiri]|uniref:Rhomboid family intramembrane serine protease n=2 Tax=Corynebacterium tapiri TaxID=1448266 RepID=A0A5C4U409_9CORY|nr:rhomboid family intramembrane serine protease [Corynebacterium tapiri]
MVCLVVFLVTIGQSSSDAINSPLGQQLMLWGPVAAGQPWGWTRTITSGFLHLSAGHLIANMFMLALLGREVERDLGWLSYVLVYLAGLLGASTLVLLFNPNTPTAGASGAVYAVMAVLVGVSARRGADLRAPIVLVLANLAYSVIVPGISLMGHLGGFLVGAVAAWPVTSPEPRRRVRAAVIIALLTAVAAGWAVHVNNTL